MEMTIWDALLKGIESHKSGDLQEADRLYTAILKAQPNHPDANHNMGVLAVGVGKLEEAVPFFESALEANPTIEQFWLSHIQNLKALERTEEAVAALKRALVEGFKSGPLKQLGEQLYLSEAAAAKRKSDSEGVQREPPEDAIQEAFELYTEGKFQEAFAIASMLAVEFPNSMVLNNILGAVCVELEDHVSAIEKYQKALSIDRDNPGAHYNIGVVHQEVGNLNAAIENYENAIAINPAYVEARSNLAVIFRLNGLLDASIEQCRIAIDYNPSFVDAYNNMGIALSGKGESHLAVEYYDKAINLRPGHADAYFNMGLALRDLKFNSYSPTFAKRIVELLECETLVDPNEIMTPIVSLLKLDPNVNQALSLHSNSQLSSSLHQIIGDLSKVPLLLVLMRVSPVPDLEVEALLTSLRRSLLLTGSDSNELDDFKPFIMALALQCFITEYIYCHTDEEAKALSGLEASTESRLAAGLQPNSISLLCLASYKALHEYRWSKNLQSPEGLEDLIRVQILEPVQEQKLRAQIRTLQEITDDKSIEVQKQYEDNPYPRWLYSRLHRKPGKISEVAAFLDLKIVNENIFATHNPQILIAGCGTGQNSLGVASRFSNCEVLAVDLSLSSLCYARRKSEEFGFDNIQYEQADILSLGNLRREFDLIESSGVLHHMEDPMKGWKTLVQLLKPGGLIKIGLYSEFGRQHIVRIRNEILEAEVGITAQEMKQFRAECMLSATDAHIRLAQTTDFYSLSALRDLIFHVQEHRFTLPQIKACLEELGLGFCGFELRNSTAMRNFRIKNSAPNDVHCLEKWNAFEEQNPTVFGEMYQFWCQKMH